SDQLTTCLRGPQRSRHAGRRVVHVDPQAKDQEVAETWSGQEQVRAGSGRVDPESLDAPALVEGFALTGPRLGLEVPESQRDHRGALTHRTPRSKAELARSLHEAAEVHAGCDVPRAGRLENLVRGAMAAIAVNERVTRVLARREPVVHEPHEA